MELVWRISRFEWVSQTTLDSMFDLHERVNTEAGKLKACLLSLSHNLRVRTSQEFPLYRRFAKNHLLRVLGVWGIIIYSSYQFFLECMGHTILVLRGRPLNRRPQIYHFSSVIWSHNFTLTKQQAFTSQLHVLGICHISGGLTVSRCSFLFWTIKSTFDHNGFPLIWSILKFLFCKAIYFYRNDEKTWKSVKHEFCAIQMWYERPSANDLNYGVWQAGNTRIKKCMPSKSPKPFTFQVN